MGIGIRSKSHDGRNAFDLWLSFSGASYCNQASRNKKIFAIDSAFLHFPLRSSSLLVICLAINIWNDPEERERCSVWTTLNHTCVMNLWYTNGNWISSLFGSKAEQEECAHMSLLPYGPIHYTQKMHMAIGQLCPCTFSFHSPIKCSRSSWLSSRYLPTHHEQYGSIYVIYNRAYTHLLW